MSRFRWVAVAIVTAALASACARQGAAPAEPRAEFVDRARVVAAAWRETVAGPRWRDGLLPLQDLTVLPPGLSDDQRLAFRNGTFTSTARLPGTVPSAGRVAFPDGTVLPVPLVSARTAYDDMRRGNPPCAGPGSPPPAAPGRTVAPGPTGASPAGSGSGAPDGSVGGPVAGGCTALTVTGVRLGSAPLRTSRGPATVPAWIFTVTGVPAPVARVAVAPDTVAATPTAQVPPAGTTASYTGAQRLTSVEGARLDFTIGVGSCQEGPRGLVHETDDMVVLGGDPGVARAGGCPALLKLVPVSVTLAEPLGDRPVVDAVTGRLLIGG